MQMSVQKEKVAIVSAFFCGGCCDRKVRRGHKKSGHGKHKTLRNKREGV